MKGKERLLKIIGEISNEFVQEAEQENTDVRKSRKGWIGAAAACLCLMILWQGGFVPFSRMGGDVDPDHIWKEGFSPESYFEGYSENESTAGGGDSKIHSAASMPEEEDLKITSLTGQQKELERMKLIPVMTHWNEFYGILTEEENQTNLWIQWLRTDPVSPPCLSVMLTSGEGQDVKREGVLNQRDGVFIIASGTEGTAKQLSYEREGVITTINGSAQVTFKEMVEVLDWYWAHPKVFEKMYEWATQMEAAER